MKKYFPMACVLLLLFVSVCAAQDKTKGETKPQKMTAQDTLQTTLADRETKLWEAWKTHQAAPFQEAMSEDSILVGGTGVDGKAPSISEITSAECTITDYALSDFKVTMFDKDAAMLTYKATQHGACGGTTVPANVVASSLWLKRGGKWYMVFHQESPTPESMAKP
jgi:hypothetical protein